MPRLFTGLEIPDDLRDELAEFKMPLPGARWVPADDLHITIRFLGDIDRRTAAEFADLLATIDIGAFVIRLMGFGAFGGNDPRTLWAGVESSPELDALARAHERAARSVGLAPIAASYKPHVTLARFRNTRPETVARFFERRGAFRSDPFLVTRFVLMSSRPLVGGGPYVIEDAFTLQGAPPTERFAWDDPGE